MNKQEYDKCVEQLTEDRKKVSKGKREDYTRGSEDVLANFKNQAEALDVDPKVSLAVHMEKQFSAVLNYIKTNGESESEPIIKRIGDTINYLELLWGLINEEEDEEGLNLFERQEAEEIYPYTPDEAFHQTKIKTLSFRLREDVMGIGTRGYVLTTSKPNNHEYMDKKGRPRKINLFEDERFKLLD